MQEAAAAEQKVAEAAVKKAQRKKENVESEVKLGLRTGAKKSGSGLGVKTSSHSHLVTSVLISLRT